MTLGHKGSKPSSSGMLSSRWATKACSRSSDNQWTREAALVSYLPPPSAGAYTSTVSTHSRGNSLVARGCNLSHMMGDMVRMYRQCPVVMKPSSLVMGALGMGWAAMEYELCKEGRGHRIPNMVKAAAVVKTVGWVMSHVGMEGHGGTKVNGCRRLPWGHLVAIRLHHRIRGGLVPPNSLLDGVNPHPSLVRINIFKLFCAYFVLIVCAH